MRYTRPDIGEHKLAYRGRRYWIIELTPGGEFDFVTHELGDYAMYDCLYNGVLATLKNTDDGGISGTLMSHVELMYAFNDVEEAAALLPKYWAGYCRSTC
jgi:hypothetical protein